MRKLIYLSLLLLLYVASAFGHEDSNEGHSGGGGEYRSSRVGNGKAVEAYSEKTGIRLSKKAIDTLGVKTASIGKKIYYQIPKTSVVHIRDKVGIYVLRDGYFKLIEVNIAKKDLSELLVQSNVLRQQEIVVTQGAALIRVAELDLLSGEEDSHE